MYENTEFTNCPEIPQILSTPLRRESYPVPEGEEMFKMPTWNCFFCRDTGWAQYHLAARAIQNYNPNRDANAICQRCGLGGRWMHLKGNIDLRLTKDTCEALDQWDRQNWEETNAVLFKQFKKYQETGVNQAYDAACKIASFREF
jgi:hypothetical protein